MAIMDVIKAIQQRRSVRAYQDTPVPEDALNTILEAARLAPSANNRQNWKFIVIRDPDKLRTLVEVGTNQTFVGEAPAVIVAVALEPSTKMKCEVETYAVDLTIAVDHMTLAAVELGLGSCWIGSFFQEKVKKILNIPDRYKVAALLPIGYPKDRASAKIRKPLSEIVCYDTWQ